MRRRRFNVREAGPVSGQRFPHSTIRGLVALALSRLPKYLVLEPRSTVRVEMLLQAPSCEIDVELENPRPGRSFVLLIGHKEGPFVQRVRLAGRARIFFDPQSPGEYVLLVANPQAEPIVLRLRARNIGPLTPTKAGVPKVRIRTSPSKELRTKGANGPTGGRVRRSKPPPPAPPPRRRRRETGGES